MGGKPGLFPALALFIRILYGTIGWTPDKGVGGTVDFGGKGPLTGKSVKG